MKFSSNQAAEKVVDILGRAMNSNDSSPSGLVEEIVDMENYKPPRMLTIKQTAATGILSETALRTMAQEGRLPGVLVGNRLYINFDRLCLMFNTAVAGCYDEE